MLRNFPAFSLCLKYKERESEAVAGPGCRQDLTIDNTTLTVGHRVKNSDLRTIIMEAKGSPARMVSIHL